MKKSVSKKNLFLFLCILAAGVFCACGMEDYIYLYPVQEGNISIRLTEEAIIELPSVSSEGLYFTHFAIFYRIYISGENISSAITSPELMRTISPALYNDYSGIYPSTSNNSSSTSVNTSIGSLFSSRRYYELELDRAGMASVLDSGSQEEKIVIMFPPLPGVIPTLTVRGNTYNLWRSTGNGSFHPQPDRYFVNTPELNASVNASATVNADVADQSGISGPRYTYVSIYIVKVGRDSGTLSNIYSSPTFIGILKLPDAS
ncbi:MAG: hypothetical protein LBG10_02500 [Treponema sp.]|jgi:hypothetical protein|nr:hypothetical protein [Treponema sp.]